ncbi:MAG TPA: acetyl-CoA C-acyltransferase, partial [Pseudonocardiaceae bacterium]|nr:acetyl-CoA C-acyltransferase [Pseudonocardiaceae bacterium]
MIDDVVICEPVRTPVGRQGGVFGDLTAAQLATSALTSLMERTGLGEGDVDDVLLGQCYANSEAPAIGRVAALNAGLGVGVGGLQIDRRCGSGLQAVLYGCLQVGAGVSDVVIAGGVESMSQSEHYVLGLRRGVRGDSVQMVDRIARGRVTAGGDRYPVPGGMLETAENLREEYSISREEQDEFALRSQRAAGAAMAEGRFEEEIVAVNGISQDEHPRPDVTLEKLAALRPVMRGEKSTVTAGNSSGQNDGAAMCVITTRKR